MILGNIIIATNARMMICGNSLIATNARMMICGTSKIATNARIMIRVFVAIILVAIKLFVNC